MLRLIEQLTYIGTNLNHLVSLRNLPRFTKDLRKFKTMGGDIDGLFAALVDFNSEAGTASGQYFHQDLLVSRFIYERNPLNHFDFGSRVDGFVAHVAAFRKITLMDIRPLNISGHTNRF